MTTLSLVRGNLSIRITKDNLFGIQSSAYHRYWRVRCRKSPHNRISRWSSPKAC
jgi:hypothetical protein